jgi:hypothetical protein
MSSTTASGAICFPQAPAVGDRWALNSVIWGFMIRRVVLVGDVVSMPSPVTTT